MQKIFYCALFYCVVGLALAHNHGGGFLSIFSFGRPTVTSICSGNGTAQSYLTQTLLLITTLQANTTTNAILQQKYPNFVSYVKNSTNQALSLSNCTGFVSNLKVAQRADSNAVFAAELLARKIQQQFNQVAHNATGSRGPTDVDDH